jgi:GMP synthase (glutamine-hydrolysing)
MPAILVLQHSGDDPPGLLGQVLSEAGLQLDVVRCDRGEQQPAALTGYAGLVVLGGAMGAYDDHDAPWLPHCRCLLREAVTRDLPTLAVCLGHQLLAVAAEGRVARAPRPQVGLHPVHRTPAGRVDRLFGTLVDPIRAVHWNNDLVVEVPGRAVVLATSEQGVQAMRLGSRVWGLQFHPEVDVETVTGWADTDVQHGALAADVAGERLAAIAHATPELRRVWSVFGARFAALLHQDLLAGAIPEGT